MLSLIVIKVGGSLLECPRLHGVLEEVLAARSNAVPLLIIGGGATADVVRQWDRVHQLGDDTAHTLALKAMAFNEELVLQLLPRTRRVHSREELLQLLNLPQPPGNAWPLMATETFLQQLESTPRDALPHSWDVTSDSIAAWVTLQCEAQELVLLKSVPAPVDIVAETAGEQGLVDRYFSRLSPKIAKVSWVNGRHSPAVVVPWLQFGQPVAP